MASHDAGKGPDPRPMTKEGRANYERTLRNIYGTRVKIPPPGPEREALCRRIGKAAFPRDYDSMAYATEWGYEKGMAETDALMERVLVALEKES